VPVTVKAPAGCLVNARSPAAVAAGNVETSSRIVDVLFAALAHAVDVPAQGQGTVNNVTLGNERFTRLTIRVGSHTLPRHVAGKAESERLQARLRDFELPAAT
jgi:N-methylhydantoinase B/oxoprolinase/acetone carboxylase alpha subunit